MSDIYARNVTTGDYMEVNSKTLFTKGNNVLYWRKREEIYFEVEKIALRIAGQFDVFMLLFDGFLNHFDQGFSAMVREKEIRFV